MALMPLARLYTWPGKTPRSVHGSAIECCRVAPRFHWNDSEGVPRYDAQGVNTETAAVEAAGIFHEFLEVIVMEGACLLPLYAVPATYP